LIRYAKVNGSIVVLTELVRVIGRCCLEGTRLMSEVDWESIGYTVRSLATDGGSHLVADDEVADVAVENGWICHQAVATR